MEKIMSLEKFAENVGQYVQKALPEELSKAEVRTVSLDIWNDDMRMVLLVIRPWNNIATGFCLNKHYEDYFNGNATVESIAAIIINDRKLYNISFDNGNLDNLQGGAIIYA